MSDSPRVRDDQVIALKVNVFEFAVLTGSLQTTMQPLRKLISDGVATKLDQDVLVEINAIFDDMYQQLSLSNLEPSHLEELQVADNEFMKICSKAFFGVIENLATKQAAAILAKS